MSDSFVRILKNQLELSFRMIEGEIDACPETLWEEKAGSFVFWQQILHCLAGLLYWTRADGVSFEEPFHERNAYPELERDPEGSVTKVEMRELSVRAGKQARALTDGKNDEWLLEPSPLYGKITNADVIAGQIRHVMYHAGHCDSALRERGHKTPEWTEWHG